MDRTQDWSWMPKAMPRVAELVAQRRREMGNAHVNLCWKRGVLEQQPGWFYAREGALSVGTPFIGNEVETVVKQLGAWDCLRGSPLLMLHSLEEGRDDGAN